MNNSIAELAAMRARGELTAEEFTEAKRLLQSNPGSAQPEPPKSIALPDDVKKAFDQYPSSGARGYESRPKATNSAKNIVFLLAVAGAVWVGMKYYYSKPGGTSTVAETKQATPTPEEIERKRKGFHCLSSWDGSFRPLKKVTEENIRDPDSFEHIETRITPVDAKGQHRVVMTYRARNGFGGMNVENVWATVRNSDCEMIDSVFTGG